jgi:prepilin-type N-terminal cleavage/methylation domain-containing protein
MKLKTIEKGFTMIELLVGLSIAAFVVGAASMTTITMMRLTPQNNDWAVALRQVQNSGYWISRDVQMSKGDIIVDTWPNATLLTLTVSEWDTVSGEVVDKTIVYEFEDMSGEQWLVRTESIGENIIGQTAIAQYISTATAQPYVPDTPLTFTIEATLGSAEVSREYEVMQRVPAPEP